MMKVIDLTHPGLSSLVMWHEPLLLMVFKWPENGLSMWAHSLAIGFWKKKSTDGLAWFWVGSKLVNVASMLTGGCKGRTKNFLLGEPKYQNFYYAIGSMGAPII